MSEPVGLVLFKSNGRFVGIDSSEIIKVVDSGKDIGTKQEQAGAANLIYSDKLLEEKTANNYTSALIIKNNNNKQFILKIPVLVDMISVPDTDIIPVPEFIKNRQNPFLVWGFIEKGRDLIMLITFDYYY
jgi:chemotaxis signal transduction protein